MSEHAHVEEHFAGSNKLFISIWVWLLILTLIEIFLAYRCERDAAVQGSQGRGPGRSLVLAGRRLRVDGDRTALRRGDDDAYACFERGHVGHGELLRPQAGRVAGGETVTAGCNEQGAHG